MITVGLLTMLGAAPGAATRFVEPLNIAAERYHIDTKQRLAAWLAQIMHESSFFARVSENLSYSAQGLSKTWPSRYAEADGTPNALARRIAYDPVAIANHTYGDRMGNGPAGSGEGYKYRGAGLIQITGKDNHAACGIALGLPLLIDPTLLHSPLYAALSAGWFWESRRLNDVIDRGDIDTVSRRINGGTIGLAERRKLYNKALEVI